MFDVYIDSIISEYKETLTKKVEKNGLSEYIDVLSCDWLFEGIKAKLLSMVARTLINEMYILKAEGLLRGDTSKQRYLFFDALTKTTAFREKIDLKYPMLKNLIDQHTHNTCSYVMEIIWHFKDDKNELETLLNKPLTKITDIKLGSGDSHNGGKTVAVIYFGDNLAVYKPHTLNGNNVLEGIIKWLSEADRIQTPLRMQKYLPRNNYGWERFVEYRECTSMEEVQRFYYRIGCFLAIFSSLGSTDLHYENIIADGEYPIFVDLETLIGSEKNRELQTILETGLLPQISENQLIDVDISGITGKSGKSAKIKNIIICNDGTDQMYVKEESAEIRNQRNIAKTNCQYLFIFNVCSDLCKGYRLFFTHTGNSRGQP